MRDRIIKMADRMGESNEQEQEEIEPSVEPSVLKWNVLACFEWLGKHRYGVKHPNFNTKTQEGLQAIRRYVLGAMIENELYGSGLKHLSIKESNRWTKEVFGVS